MGTVLQKHEPAWLCVIELATTRYYATRDLYVSGQKYTGSLAPDFHTEEELFDLFFGVEDSRSVTLRLNGVSFDEEIRDKTVKLYRYDPQDGATFEFRGKIASFREDPAGTSITAESRRDPVLETLLPKKCVNTDDFPDAPEQDIGKPISIPLGQCRNVPLRLINNDTVNDHYDYLAGYGTLENVWEDEELGFGVRRNGKLVNTAEYTFYDGSQGSPYPGFAFIRFVEVQKDFAGRFYTLTADLKGLEMGGAAAEANFANVIKNVLNNATWGLGDQVDAASFSAAATDLPSGTFVCSLAITDQREAGDILHDLLFPARAFLERAEDGEWEITVDKPGSSDETFTDGAGCTVESVSSTPVSEAVKTATVRFGFDDGDNERPYRELSVSVFSFGEERTYDLLATRANETAKKVASYIKNRYVYADQKVVLQAGMKARDLRRNQIITLTASRHGIDAELYKIERIRKGIAGFTLYLAAYSSNIYGDESITDPTYPGGDTDPAIPPGDEVAAQFTNALENIDRASEHAPTVGENVNVWNQYIAGTAARLEYGLSVKIAKATGRIYFRASGFYSDATDPGLTYAFEIEVFGATVTGYTNVSFNATIANKGSDVDFATDDSQWGPNGAIHDEFINSSGTDEGYWTLDSITKDVVFRLRIQQASLSGTPTGGGHIFISLGDRVVAVDPSIPFECYFNPADSEDYDVLIMENAPAQPGADKTQDHADLVLDNPTFEAGDVGYAKGGGWIIASGNQFMGSYCAESPGAGGGGALINQFKFPSSEGERVLLQAWVKADDGTDGTCYIIVRWYNASDVLISNSDPAGGNSIPGTNWEWRRGLAVGPANTAYGRMAAAHWDSPTTGGLYVDNLFGIRLPKNADINVLETENAPEEADANNTETRTSLNTSRVEGSQTRSGYDYDLYGDLIVRSGANIKLYDGGDILFYNGSPGTLVGGLYLYDALSGELALESKVLFIGDLASPTTALVTLAADVNFAGDTLKPTYTGGSTYLGTTTYPWDIGAITKLYAEEIVNPNGDLCLSDPIKTGSMYPDGDNTRYIGLQGANYKYGFINVIKTNTIYSDDYTYVTISDGLRISGVLRAGLAESSGGINVEIDSYNNIYKLSSSARYKDNIRPLERNPEDVLRMIARSYESKATSMPAFGFVAEEAAEAGLSYLVAYDAQGRPDGIRHNEVFTLAVEVVKKHDERIKALEGQEEYNEH